MSRISSFREYREYHNKKTRLFYFNCISVYYRTYNVCLLAPKVTEFILTTNGKPVSRLTIKKKSFYSPIYTFLRHFAFQNINFIIGLLFFHSKKKKKKALKVFFSKNNIAWKILYWSIKIHRKCTYVEYSNILILFYFKCKINKELT